MDFLYYVGGTSHTLQDGASFIGPGFTNIEGGSLYVADQALATVENLEFSEGDLRGTGTLSISDTFIWTGGTMSDAGITRVENTAGMSISGSAVKRLDGPHVLENAGTVTWTGTGDMHFANAGVFNNLAGATFDAQNDANIWYAGGASSVFNNAGTLVKSTGTGTTRIGGDIQFNNTGTVIVQSGTLQFDVDNFAQTEGAAILDGGDIASGATLDFQGGTLTGSGTIDASVDSAAEVSPGSSAGTIDITGNYEQFASGVLTVELSGTAAGEFDLLEITGSAVLDGALNVTLIDDYVPGDGEAFTILTANTVTGTFASENLPALPDELIWDVTYEPDRVTLAVGYDCNGNGLPDQYDPFADFNGDGDLDLTDYANFAGCMTAPCGPDDCDPPLYGDPCCALADVEPDGDVDLVDSAAFQRDFGG